MRQPTPTWAMASPSGRAVRAVRAIRAPTPAPMPAHQEYYDTEPDSDQDQDQNQDRDQNQDQVHLAGDGDEPEGYDMMEDNPPPLGPSPRAVHVAAPAGIPPAPALPAPPVNAVQAEQAEAEREAEREAAMHRAREVRACMEQLVDQVVEAAPAPLSAYEVGRLRSMLRNAEFLLGMTHSEMAAKVAKGVAPPDWMLRNEAKFQADVDNAKRALDIM